jgi:hypothetical protein
MSRFPTIALALAIATSAAAQTDAKKVAPGRYYFTSEGKYLAPMALSLEVESRSASLVVALPGSPYLVTKVNPTEIEFEGSRRTTWADSWRRESGEAPSIECTGRCACSAPRPGRTPAATTI